MKHINIILLGLLALTVGVVIYYFLLRDDAELLPQPAVTSYEECVAAGYAVLDSYPEQCETPDGQRFTREIGEDEVSPDVIAHIESKRDLIKVTEPTPLAVVSSPLTVRGEARGTWFFEADFPVTLVDGNGNELAKWYASAVT